MAASPGRRTPLAHRVCSPRVGIAFVALPIAALLIRAPWSHLVDELSSSGAWTALRLSIVVSLAAAALSLDLRRAGRVGPGAFGRSPAVRCCARSSILPLVLPPVVGGVGLLDGARPERRRRTLARRGSASSSRSRSGARSSATTFVSIPLVILAVEAGLRSIDPRFEEAASAMGASRGYVLRRVTLPLLRPQLAAGLVLAWARALGEFGATITFAGNLAGRTQTLPLAVYQTRQTDPGAAILISLLLVVLSLVVLVAMRDRIFAR